MKTFAIVALKRHDFTESVVGLRKCEEEARRTARQHMAAMADEFVRCRVQPLDVSVTDVKALCYSVRPPTIRVKVRRRGMPEE